MKTAFPPIVAALLLPAVASAQNSPTPRTLQGLDDFSLPASRPTPRASPVPEPTTNPRATRSPSPVLPPRIVPTSRATPTARATGTSTRPAAIVPPPIATPTLRPLPAAAPIAAPIANPTPTTVPTPTPTIAAPLSLPPVAEASPETPLPEATLPTSVAPVPAEPSFAVQAWMWQLLALVVALLAAAGSGWWWRKRGLRDDAERRDDRRHEIFVLDTAETPPVRPTPPPPLPVPPLAPTPKPLPVVPDPATRASLDLDVLPKRAGTNLLSAAVEYTILIRNIGEVAATGIRLDVRLLSAGPRQDAVIVALFDMPIAQPNTTPFDLPPGTMVDLGGMAMHPKDTLEVMEVDGRTLFVPVLAVNVTYDWDGGSGQTARSYVIGIDRGGDTKLQPFRLDASARMYDTVGALAYTAVAVS